jgi:ribonuclease P/MRP protein subunit RPP40
LQKDIDLIEGVQRRATKLVVEMKEMSYEERLKFLDMTTLETRRVRGDLIEVFKIMKGLEDVNKWLR